MIPGELKPSGDHDPVIILILIHINVPEIVETSIMNIFS